MGCQLRCLRAALSCAAKNSPSGTVYRPGSALQYKRLQRGFSQQSARLTWSTRQPNPLQRAAAVAQQVEETAESEPQADEKEAAKEKPAAQQFKGPAAGAFQRIPQVPEPEDHLRSALKRANRVSGNKKIKGRLQNARNLSARRLDALTKELAGPLGAVFKGFPTARQMHPFERALLDLTLGVESYEKRLSKLNGLRISCLEVGKSYAGKAGKAVHAREAIQVMEDGFKSVEQAFRKSATSLESVKDMARVLRKLPTVDPTTPTVALVGAPNVGKSSLVQVLSSGLPEVCNYPFTTRTVKMGHFFVDGRRHQVTDTPGLLNRKEAERNAMERLTLACLQHLPTAVIFVVDLTGECGTSLADQRAIRARLRADFPGKPWLDAFSKADLLTEVFAEADGTLRRDGSQGTDNRQAPSDQIQEQVAFVTALPSALRISSTQQLGIEELKEKVLGMVGQAKAGMRGVDPNPMSATALDSLSSAALPEDALSEEEGATLEGGLKEVGGQQKLEQMAI